jgi:hypothetical protein
MRRTLIGITAATVLLAGCGSAATSSTRATPVAIDTVACQHLANLYGNVLKPAQDGTLTTADGITALNSSEGDFQEDATFWSSAAAGGGGAKDTKAAAEYSALALAIGQFKVALSNGTDTTASAQAMATAVTALPAGNCPS